MFESSFRGEHETDPCDEAPRSRRAPGEPRLAPTVRFGLRAAVLAGVITTVGLSGAINSLAGPMETTCCPPPKVSAMR